MNTNNQNEIIQKTADHVKALLENDSSGHDWWHIYRVWQLANNIAKNETADSYIVQLGALLHDIADWKFHDGDLTVGPQQAKVWLEKCGADSDTTEAVATIIKQVSFKGAGVKTTPTTIEGKIVQDADRLDAIGAIGIGRTFAYGGHAGSIMYDPSIEPTPHKTFEEYKSKKGPVINHFYEKLLLLKDLMNTPTAKTIAQKRHDYMLEFLNTFKQEWEGKD